nr:MAG TPA: hypothetical protein [Caudoviricetes sp.]
MYYIINLGFIQRSKKFKFHGEIKEKFYDN